MIKSTPPRTASRTALLMAVAQLLTFPRQSVAADSTAGAAFLDVFKVLSHPRCMNCHPTGDAPFQGDDSHPHAFRIRRGADGKGLTSAKCINCHQATNQTGEHTPPGASDQKAEDSPRWHL